MGNPINLTTAPVSTDISGGYLVAIIDGVARRVTPGTAVPDYKPVPPGTTSLNDLKESGRYRVSDLTDGPAGYNGGILEVEKYDASRSYQRLTGGGATMGVWCRMFMGSSWTLWSRMATFVTQPISGGG